MIPKLQSTKFKIEKGILSNLEIYLQQGKQQNEM